MKSTHLFLLIFFQSISITSSAQDFDVLVFSKTAGFRHASIETGRTAIQELGADNGFSVVLSENSDDFIIENLVQFETVIFLSTTGDILNADQQEAFEAYIAQGGGYVGIHAASDTEYTWDWYGGLVGAYFDSHPAIQEAVIEIPDKVHPSTSFLEDYWTRRDEWYNYRENPRGKVHVLATLDESTYNGGNMGHDHPITWCHEYEGGRSWYTGGGHTVESYSENDFMQHILGGILYTSGQIPGDFTATINEKYDVTVLDDNPLSPMAISVLPSLDVLYIERAGKVKLQKEASGTISVAGELDVDSGREDGLIGITIDPDFSNNNWIYLFYSPANEEKQHVSRFDFIDDKIVLESEKIILEIPVQRAECCHSGGDLEFDQNGDLWIATGDNVNPFESGGYSPIDERANREPFDAQGTSANTHDLRGKILRIHPEENGTYTVPSGNLFSTDTEGLPEIYVMGVRNPFRIALSNDGELVWGDVGPDANGNSSTRGPRGYDEVNRTSSPGNFGWPYAVANNKAYSDYNFETQMSGSVFDLDNLFNNSPNNNGVVNIPPAQEAWIHYHSGFDAERPELFAPGGRSIVGGAFYDYQAANQETNGLPEYFNNTLFIGDWSRNWIKEVKVDADGKLLQINPFIPHIDINSPIDIEIGPDGNIYIVEWGTGFTNDNADARIMKVSYMSTAGNKAPTASITANVYSGLAPLDVQFDGSLSKDPDVGDNLTYSWDLNDDGEEDSNESNPSFTYTENGVYMATLQVMDQEGEMAIAQTQIVVGNSAPTIEITFPMNGGFFEVFDTINYSVTPSDLEDGNECDNNLPLGISIEPSIGHDDHAHGEGAQDGCEGVFLTSPHGDGADDVFYVLNAQYSDRGGAVAFPLTASSSNILQPKTKQAQYAQEYFDIRTESTGDFLGGDLNMAYINHNSHLKYSPMNFENIDFLTVRWAALNKDSRIEVRIDSVDGQIIAERSLPVTGGWQIYDFYTMPLNNPGGTHDVYVIFKKPGNTSLGNINFMEFHGKGISTSNHQEGMGLTATYFENSDFSGQSVSRVEPMIAWDWDLEDPIQGINASDGFSVRWEGSIIGASTANYTIAGLSTGGNFSINIDGQDVSNSVFSFNQGQEYKLTVEYVHNFGDASMSLRWEGPNPMNVIHTKYLRSKNQSSRTDDSFAQEITAYPTIFNHELFISNLERNTHFKLLNLNGQIILEGNYNGLINTSKLSRGVYFLRVGDENFKLLKLE